MTIPAQHLLEDVIAAAWPAPNWQDSHVLLAVSGGADSTALLRAVLALKQRDGGPGRLFAAHLHHGLRGPAAENDQIWLETLCRRWNIPLEVGRADVEVGAVEQGDGIEAAARRARYEFLCATAEKIGARLVAVGHTADDQVETILHRILRGTGLTGLAGMPDRRPLSPSVALVRPMLNVCRDDVRQYLEALGQDFRTDETNSDPRFTRNWLRNELLPAIRSHVNSDVGLALLRLAKQSGETHRLISANAAALATRCMSAEGESPAAVVRIDCRLLAGQPLPLVREVCRAAWQSAGWSLQAMGFDEWQQLAELVAGDQHRHTNDLPGSICARRVGDTLELRTRDH